MFLKKDLKILRGFDEQFQIASDFDFCIRLSTLGTVGYSSELLGYYLNNGQGASTQRGSRQPFEREAIYMRYGNYSKIDLEKFMQVHLYDLK